jgi:glycosyltransferase involved in cell wall biosynthesis
MKDVKGQKTLVIAPFGICPAHQGNRRRVSSLTEVLREFGHDVWFLGLGLSSPEQDGMRNEWGDRFANAERRKVYNVRPWWSALWKMLAKYPVQARLFCPNIDFWYQPQWDKDIARLRSRCRFDHVIVSYIFFSRSLLNFGPETTKIIDTHDVFTDRDLKLRKMGTPEWNFACVSGERKALRRADIVLAIQEEEARWFRNALKFGRRVVTHGHVVEIVDTLMASPRTPTVGFLGNANVVNRSAVQWFLSKSWPEIRRRVPSVRFLLAGQIASFVRAPFSSDESMIFIASIDRLSEFYERVTVVINPALSGTGLKIKSVEALGFGRPLVCSPEGARGIDPSGGAFLVAATAQDFANQVVRVLRDDAFAQALASRASEYAEVWNRRQRAALGSIFGHYAVAGRP